MRTFRAFIAEGGPIPRGYDSLEQYEKERRNHHSAEAFKAGMDRVAYRDAGDKAGVRRAGGRKRYHTRRYREHGGE